MRDSFTFSLMNLIFTSMQSEQIATAVHFALTFQWPEVASELPLSLAYTCLDKMGEE
jgi:hypothetical protein